MKTLGIIFIMVSAVSAGIRIGSVLKSKCMHLQYLLDALLLFKNELTYSAKPLPELCAVISNSAQGNVKEMFADISDQMQNNRWLSFKTALEHALNRYPDDTSEETLLELASSIGQYDLQAQIGGIDLAMIRIRQLLRSMESERSMKSKTYKTLSICAGLAVVILLL